MQHNDWKPHLRQRGTRFRQARLHAHCVRILLFPQRAQGQQWFFGMKLYIGVDDALGLIHSLATTPANASDIAHAGDLLHGDEERGWGDAGYTGIEKREEHQARDVTWLVK